jgi:hypothetical protein
MRTFPRAQRALTMLAIVSLLQPTVTIPLGAQSTAKPATKSPPPPTATAAKPAAATAAAPAPIDGGWPRRYLVSGGGDITIYQPQIATWDQQRHMVAFSAVQYAENSTAKPSLGTIKLEADTQVATTERLVQFDKVKIAETNFASLDRDKVRQITATIDKTVTADIRVIALDRVLANLNTSSITAKNMDGVKADPPTIYFSKTPAVIVNLDGEAIWSPIENNDLKYAVNTNWDLFQYEPGKAYYLRNNNTWLKAADLKGPWTAAGTLPASFSKLPADDNWKDVRVNMPGVAVKTPPSVYVSQTPAEIILLTGEPAYTAVTGTQLLWVGNTESDVFRMGRTGTIYYLVAGRWFSAPDFTGPWTFATLALPEDFKKISLEHPRSRVLASVPGTSQAAEAVLLAQIPQTARVNMKQVKAPDVAYQGQPSFQPIETTVVQRAVNTDKDIFKVGADFYMCYQGVWFIGKSAEGPWEVAKFVPEEIYKIPISSPSHHVTYVTVEKDDDDNDEWVVFAAAAAYTGVMIAWGCAVWGSGWYYPPYYGYGARYPYYYGHYPTYGYSAWYNPYTGGYGRSAGVYGPYGGAGVSARYNPRTGTYSRGAAAYGPYGARGAGSAYNPRTGAYGQTRQGSNVYGSWGSTAVQRGDDWAATNRVTNNRTGTTTRTIRTDDGSAVTRTGPRGGTAAVTDGGNVYAGRDGNVYRKEGGTWQKHEDGGWSNTDRQPTRPEQQRTGGATAGTTDRSTVDQLERDSAARREGSTRTKDAGTYQRGGSTSSGGSVGSYRGGGATRSGGGASRGGGGGRRR